MFLSLGSLSIWENLVVGATLHAFSRLARAYPKALSSALLFEPTKFLCLCPLTLDSSPSEYEFEQAEHVVCFFACHGIQL